MNCTPLAANIDNCSATPQVGFEEEALIIAIDDIASKTITGNLVTGITKKVGTVAHTIKVKQALKPYDGTTIKSAQKLAAVLFDGETKLILLGNNPTVAEQVAQLSAGRYAIIFKQKQILDNGKYLIMGIETGLKFGEATFTAYGDAAGWEVTLKEEMAINAANFFYVGGSVGATDAAYEALKSV